MTITRNVILSEMLARVQEKGQVTIPSQIRKKLKLKKGDLVVFEETETGIMISPRKYWCQTP